MFRIPLPIPPNVVPLFRGSWSHVRTQFFVWIILSLTLHHITSSFTDWFFFLVLDIGNSAFEQIPFGQRVLLGLMQASAVRASGFASVPLAALAPGVK